MFLANGRLLATQSFPAGIEVGPVGETGVMKGFVAVEGKVESEKRFQSAPLILK